MAYHRPLKGAIIGYGFIASEGHLKAYESRAREIGDVEIVAVADICAARRDLAAQRLKKARIYTDFDILIEEEAGLDFVDICTPAYAHAEIALLALNKKLHVLCEKPLTTSIDDATELLKAAQRNERVLFPCHNYKYAPVVKRIRQILENGGIGRVHSLTLQTFRNTHAKGVSEWHKDWRRDKRYSGGGIAMDHGSHTLYLTFDWLGTYPTAVTAKMGNLSEGKFDTEDNCSALLTFPNGLAQVYLTWTAGVRKVLYTIQGDRGAITVDDDEIQVAIQKPTDGEDVAQGAISWDVQRETVSSHWMDASHTTWFNALFDQFLKAIDQKEFLNKEILEAFRCIDVITTAYLSHQEGSREMALHGLPADL